MYFAAFMLIWISAVILGLVEGVTEFLPVSSTGHLILTGHLLGFTGPRADCFEVFIQFGAILAVVWMFRDRFLALIPWRPANAPIPGAKALRFVGWRGLGLLALVTLPGMIIGKALHGTIKTHLFTPLTVAMGLAVGGVFILLVERFGPKPRHGNLDEVTWKHALTIGFFQCLALWPGMSRASSTLLGGMLLGFDRKTAAEFSFLAAVPLIAAASFYDLYKNLGVLQAEDIGLFAVGFFVAMASAWFAVRFFLNYLARHTLSVFGYYRLGMALLAWWVFSGK